MAQKVIIDADPGIGDAVAIASAILDPNIDVVGITATAGCVSGEVATRNIQAVVEQLDPSKWPRLGASSARIPSIAHEYEHGVISSSELNGSSGLGDWEFSVAALIHARESAKLIADIVRSEPNEITLITLGPLTNVELACERAPGFLNLLKGLICLGGSVEFGGNVTASAEFNIYADPQAARTVLRTPATKTLVPLDVSRRAVMTFEQFDRLPCDDSSQLGRFLHQLLPFAFRAHHEHLGLEGVRLHELVALCAITQPQLFESRSMVIDVETRGELTRGMTVFDRRGISHWQTNIDVLCDVDVQGVLDYFTRIVRRGTL